MSRATCSGLRILGSRKNFRGYGVSAIDQPLFSVATKKNRSAPVRWLTVFAASFRSQNK